MKSGSREIGCYNVRIALKFKAISTALLPRSPSNFRAIGKNSIRISRLHAFAISCGKMSVCLVNIGPAGLLASLSLGNRKITWWRHQMETFSALLDICAGNSPVTGEFPTQRPVTWSFEFFYLRLTKRLSKQWWSRWFEMPSRPLWRHCNDPRTSEVIRKYIDWISWCKNHSKTWWKILQ